MKVLNLFDGMNGVRIGTDRAIVEVDLVCSDNCQNAAHLGDITKWREWDIDWSEIDFVTGHFPCQAWTMEDEQIGYMEERGLLFYAMLEMIAMVRSANPDADFLIEECKDE